LVWALSAGVIDGDGNFELRNVHGKPVLKKSNQIPY
jgi:hypothetical protein